MFYIFVNFEDTKDRRQIVKTDHFKFTCLQDVLCKRYKQKCLVSKHFVKNLNTFTRYFL